MLTVGDPTAAGVVDGSGLAPRRPGLLARDRSHWGVLDQVLASVTNLVPSVLLARALGARDFGAFAAVFTATALTIGFVRALVGEPLLVRAEQVRRSGARVRSGALGVGLAVGAGLGAIAGTAALLAPGWTARSLVLATAITLPGILVQDVARYVLFASLRHRDAFLNDLLWLATMAAAYAGFAVGGVALTATAGLLIWGGTGWIAAGAALVQLRARPSAPSELLRAHADLGRHFALQYFAVAGAGQLALYLLGAVGGLEDLGSVRAVQLLFGPMNVIFLGAYVTLLPKGVGRDLLAFRRALVRASLALTALASACTALLLVTPTAVGEALLGDTWSGARPLVLPYGLYMVALTVATGPSVGLAALERARTLTVIRVGSIPAVVLASVGAGAAWGARGYVYGLAAAGLALTIVWWGALGRDLARTASPGPS